MTKITKTKVEEMIQLINEMGISKQGAKENSAKFKELDKQDQLLTTEEKKITKIMRMLKKKEKKNRKNRMDESLFRGVKDEIKEMLSSENENPIEILNQIKFS